MTRLEDVFAVQQLVARFADSFDIKDRAGLGRRLADRLQTDYSDLRGTPPETMSRERFVELKRTALNDLQTHHLSANVEVKPDGDSDEAKVPMVIYRRNAAGEIPNTHCLYSLGTDRTANAWATCSIVQTVFMNARHAGIDNGILQP